MTEISVTKTVNGDGGLYNVDVDEILFLKFEKSITMILFHTRDAIYYTMGSVKHWTVVLNASGYNFMSVDRGTALNLDKIVYLDRSIRAACFEVDSSADSPKCLLAMHAFKKLCKTLSVPVIGEEPRLPW
ncbi:hypothetical protein D3C81_1343350 [compost metagenome]